MKSFKINKGDIDPEDFSKEELQDIIFYGLFAAKILETLPIKEEKSIEVAYNVIKHFDDVPHEYTPSDFVTDKALSSWEK